MSTENLISKKELLEKYKISYGALYRWKRMGLIPEEWFIKKATSTGQETFFPMALACERVELILSSKDDTSLENLAKTLKGKEKADAYLLLDTVFGVKTLKITELRGAKITRGGAESDIFEFIKKTAEEI